MIIKTLNKDTKLCCFPYIVATRQGLGLNVVYIGPITRQIIIEKATTIIEEYSLHPKKVAINTWPGGRMQVSATLDNEDILVMKLKNINGSDIGIDIRKIIKDELGYEVHYIGEWTPL